MMNSKMNIISVVLFLFFVGSDGINKRQDKFRECRSFLDDYATTDCQRAQNIHFCAELLNGQIKSRGNQELNRLGCSEEAKNCKTKNIQRCQSNNNIKSCSEIARMKKCLYEADCTSHYQLLDKYYTDKCLKDSCNSTDVTACDSSAADTKTDTVCRNLKKEYNCVLSKRQYTNNICKMPAEWQKAYNDNKCEQACYEISKPNLNGLKDEEKCKSFKDYKIKLDDMNCKMPDDMKNQYNSLKCDNCSIKIHDCEKSKYVDDDWSRKYNCRSLSSSRKCFKNIDCSTPQIIDDQYAFYECGTSCDGNVESECIMNIKEPLNSTRDEQCGFFKEYLTCSEKSRCETNDKYMKLLECNGAASRDTMFAIIIVALPTVQMLGRYISLI